MKSARGSWMLGAASLLVLAGTVGAQSRTMSAPAVRTGTFRGTIPARAMAAPSPARSAPAAQVSATQARAIHAAARPQHGGSVAPPRRPIVPPTMSIPSGGGRAALPGTPSVMPRSTGAGLAPTRVAVPEYTVLPPGQSPGFDQPLPTPYVDHRGRGGSHNQGFTGPLPPDGIVHGASRRGTFADASGFSANIRYSDDNFRLGIHIGSGADAWCRDNWKPWWSSCSWYDACRPSWCYPSYANLYPWGWSYGSYWPYYYDYSYTLPVVNDSYVMYQDPALSPSYSPAAAQAQAAPVLTDFQRGAYLMQSRRYAEAVSAFRAVIKADPGDAAARRWLGIGLLLQGRTQDGANEIARAYAQDPTLADASPDLEGMGLTVRQMTDLCAPVITYARRVNSSSGYIAAAMLMQIRSRPDLAAKMLNSAREAGLESGLLVDLTQGMAR